MDRELFFETYKFRTKTYLLYGNFNDIYFSDDLQERYFEEYLLACLKNRGFEHIVFYADSGTKGEFWLDRESERFFQKANVKHTQIQRTEMLNLRNRNKRRASVPGSLSEEKTEERPKGEKDGFQASERQEAPGVRRVAYNQKQLSEFVSQISPLMQQKKSKMAVVFCNIFNNSIDTPELRECILNDWEKYQEEGSNNICILLATETIPNPFHIIQLLKKVQLESKFVYANGTEEYLLPTHCFNIGLPGIDEIQNYLKRIFRGGLISDSAIKPIFRYRDIPFLAREILNASKQYNSERDSNIELMQENLRDIIGRIEGFYRDAVLGTYEFSREIIYQIWGIQAQEKDCLQELDRPGWEAAYEVVSSYEPTEKQTSLASSDTKQHDIVVQRFKTSIQSDAETRKTIPNFVLLGNPGTGKTSIARLIGDILHSWNYLNVGHVVEVTKKDLTSSYIAGITHATMNCVHQAEEGVLFIDEAHLIGHEDGGVNNAGSGKEIVSTLNAAITNPNYHFSLILAGYEEEMKKVFDLDPGFRSRFGDNVIVIHDYKPELLRNIISGYIEQQGYKIDDDLLRQNPEVEQLHFPNTSFDCFVKKIYDERDREKFGNAREMIGIADRAIKKSKDNILKREDFYNADIDESWFHTEDIAVSVDWIIKELESNMKGMDRIKEMMIDLAYELQECRDTGKDIAEVGLRGIILVGNPGTGKTTISDLLGRLYYRFGVLGTASVIRVSASKFASSFQGGSQEIVQKYIKKAQDRKAILFVDEAHQLTNRSFDGMGALQTFMEPITNSKKPFMPMFAVYPHMLQSFLDLDPGLTSRMRIMKLDDYTGEQLYEILNMMAQRKGYAISEDALPELKKICDEIYENSKKEKATGNARRMERLLEDMNIMRRRRIFRNGIDAASDEGKLFLLEDIVLSYTGM